MQAVLLAGGEGTRLRPLTYGAPKPLLPVMGRPLVAHLMDRLPAEVDTVLLTVSYRGNDLRRWAETSDDPALAGREVVVVEEHTPLGTAGAVQNCADVLDGAFFVLNADLISDVDLGGLLRFHRAQGALGTLALYKVGDPSRFGVVAQEQDGRITRFVEKPAPGDAPSDRVNAGAYVLAAETLELIPKGVPASLERDVFPRAADTAQGLYGQTFEGLWIDCGTPQSYLDVHRALLHRAGQASHIGPESEVAADATVERSWLGAHVHVAAGATVLDSVILDGARIGPGARVTSSILADGCRVGAHAHLEATVVGRGEQLPDGAAFHGARVGLRAEHA